jgi:hypothetical protein
VIKRRFPFRPSIGEGKHSAVPMIPDSHFARQMGQVKGGMRSYLELISGVYRYVSRRCLIRNTLTAFSLSSIS